MSPLRISRMYAMPFMKLQICDGQCGMVAERNCSVFYKRSQLFELT